MITFATGNATKVAFAREHLAPYGIRVRQLDLALDELQSTSVQVVACHKARHAFAQIGEPLIVEDSGMFIPELGGWPGALVKHLLDAAGAAGLTHLAGLTNTRSCYFSSALAYVGPDGDLTAFTERSDLGTIAMFPASSGALGAATPLWDVYVPPGAAVPLSSMPEPQRRAIFDAWSTRSVFAQFGRWIAAHSGTAPTMAGAGPHA